MSEDLVNIEVDGVKLQARKGQMLIHATDAAGIYVPRFCYHEKLSIAANCRMCLVEVEKAPKPLPACATPVAEGMKAFTKSPKAISAQKATMEFLLINHPLDCPICDQGGECELQDLAVGYGRDVSRYVERKRVVKDANLGPLVSTDMTRCIHCTRCVRFGQEIAGFPELGTVGRGELTLISTYVEKSVEHELSGNIIDLCPVGALNNKPYRYRARSWEMSQHALVSPHDCTGTNLYGHVLRGRLMRIVPQPNEAINETWIADRDRFSCEGLYSEDRAAKPMVREGGQWREVGWEAALEAAAKGLQQAARGKGLGTLVSPSIPVEEQYLAARLARALGSHHVDHRLRRCDTRGQDADPVAPLLGCSIAELEAARGLLVVGSRLRSEVPMLAHRIRKAVVRNGAKLAIVESRPQELLFPVEASLGSNGLGMVEHLGAVLLAALRAQGREVPAALQSALAGLQANEGHSRAAGVLAGDGLRLILLGATAQRHPAYSAIHALAVALAEASGARLGWLPEGGNAVGAALAGVLPHRGLGGQPLAVPGMAAGEMLAAGLDGYLLVGALEREDFADGAVAAKALSGAGCVVALSPYAGGFLRSHASVILPVAAYAETSGSWVNVEGTWQSVAGAARPPGEARPGWKVLRVLGNLLNLPDFEYLSSEQVRDELRRALDELAPVQPAAPAMPATLAGQGTAAEVGIYAVDAVVRRSQPLQATRLAAEEGTA